MRRSFVTPICALALALVPAALFAQTPPAQTPPQTPPAQTTPPAQPSAQPSQSGPPKIGFTTNAGLFLVQIKADQAANFEEMAAKLKAGLAKSEDASLKQMAPGLHFYKASEPAAGGNALYVVVIDPAVPNGEYAFLTLLSKTMTAEEQRAPGTQEMFKKYSDAFVQGGMNKLNLTPVSGGM